MDYDALRAGLAQAVPFNAHLGLEVAEVAAGRGVVMLPDRDEQRNHVGSQHAGALFSAGEAASGAAFVGSFAERMTDLTPLAESAEIRYLKIACGPIRAEAKLDADRDELLAELEREGRIRFAVEVSLSDKQGEEVAAMSVNWYVRAKSGE